MKLRASFFILAGTLAGVAGTAYAATSAAFGGGEAGVAMISTVAISGLSQLGAVLYLLKMYRDKVDASAKAIPELVAALKTTEAAIAGHAASIRELYGSRNTHEVELAEINTLHDFKGCKHSTKGGKP